MGLAAKTRATYDSARRNYIAFAERNELSSTLPLDPQLIVLWMTWMFAQGLQPSSIKTYLFGIASWHVEEGLPSPLSAFHIWRCWKGMKRWKGDAEKRERFPITTTVLASIKPLMKLKEPYDRLMWAAFTLGTCGLLRLGEFAVSSSKDDRILRWRHIDWYSDEGRRFPLREGKVNEAASEYRVLLEASKTDPFRKGVTIRVCAPMAVSAMRAHCNGLQEPPAFNGPVFDLRYKLDRSEAVVLSRDVVVKSIHSYLSGIGFEAKKYNGHSFRKGGAQSLADAQVSVDTIQAMGRWSSDCYKLYITTPHNTITAASLALEP